MFVTLHISHFIPLSEFVKFCVGSFNHLLRLVKQSPFLANVLSFSWHFRLFWCDSKWMLKAFMFLKVVLELESPQDSHCMTFTILSLNTTCHKQTKWPKITHISLPNSKTQNIHAYNNWSNMTKQIMRVTHVPILFPKIIKYDDNMTTILAICTGGCPPGAAPGTACWWDRRILRRESPDILTGIIKLLYGTGTLSGQMFHLY